MKELTQFIGFIGILFVLYAVGVAYEDRWIRAECYEDGSCQALVGTRLGILWDGDGR